MKLFITNGVSAETVARSFMFHAYEACGGETGMGFLQKRNDVTPENVFDFCGVRNLESDGSTCVEVYGDYVAGRMVKTGVEFCTVEKWVEVSDRNPHPEYQGWSLGANGRSYLMLGEVGEGVKFSSYRDLLNHAALSVSAHFS